MLVLNRKENESITIAGEIVIKVVEIKQSSVILGITAPRDIRIVRTELLEQEGTDDSWPRDKP